ncbi:MAG TPA: hypothetical protein ENN67_01055 [Firmicutes bacterium]|nr:hypothetical protein [Bacillota bacterium]
MSKSVHLWALSITIVAIVIFTVLDSLFDFQFGLRTYWPAFFSVYLLAWYFGATARKNKPGLP